MKSVTKEIFKRLDPAVTPVVLVKFDGSILEIPTKDIQELIGINEQDGPRKTQGAISTSEQRRV